MTVSVDEPQTDEPVRYTRRSATYIGSLTLTAKVVERLAAFAQIALIASIFGASTHSDLYFIASIIPLTIGTVLGESLATSALPILVKRHHDADFPKLLSATFWWSLLVLVVTLFGYLAVIIPVVAATAPAGSSSSLPWLAFSPTVLTLGLSAYFGAVLLLFERYTWPPFRAAVSSVAALLLTLLVLPFTHSLVWIALATTAGYAVSLLLLAVDVVRYQGLSIARIPGVAAWREAARAGKNAGVALAGNLIGGQTFVLVERALAASLGVGAVSTISYARGIVFTPNILAQATSMGLYPGMVRAHEARDTQFVRGAFLRGLRLTLLVSLVVVVYFALFGHQVVRVLLERGALTGQDTEAIARTLIAFSGAVVGTALLIITSRVFYAIDFFRGIVWSQTVALVAYVPLAFLLRAGWGTEGLAAAFAVAELAGGAVAVVLAARMTDLGSAQARALLAILKPLAVATLVMVLVRVVLRPLPPGGNTGAFVEALVGGVAGFAALAFGPGARDWPELAVLRRHVVEVWHRVAVVGDKQGVDRRPGGRSRRVALAAAAIVGALLLLFLPAVGVLFATVAIAASVARWPGALIAISWNGFWLYLGALDLLNVHSRSLTTAAYYGAVAVALAWFVWVRRETLVRRVTHATRLTWIWLIAAGLLGAWFCINVVTLSSGPLAHRLLGVFVVSTVPTAVAVGASRGRDLYEARIGLVVLGLVFVAIECVALRHGAAAGPRFSPIAELDPISASLVPSVALLAVATFRPAAWRGRLAQMLAVAALGAGASLSSGRGPLVALVLALVVVTVFSLRLRGLVLIAATCAGIFVGSTLVKEVLSQQPAVTSLVTQTSSISKPAASAPTISSLSIRKQWLEASVRAIPSNPVVGHGVGMLVDRTPEARRMGVFGQLVYPHNDLVESAFSLGIAGLVLFLMVLALPAVVLWRRRRDLRAPQAAFILALAAFAFFESNFSGEIGTDILLWSSAVLVMFTLGSAAASTARRSR